MVEKKNNAGGFTLAEVIISLLILSTALVTLLSLQASIVSRAVMDERRLEAMLIARRILAEMEEDEFLMMVGERDEIASTFVDRSVEESRGPESDLRARVTVEYWPLPTNPTALKRATVSVYWGEGENERLDIFYFAPNTDDTEPPSDPEGEDE